jgi:DNA-binding MarR family transcriptional regulator
MDEPDTPDERAAQQGVPEQFYRDSADFSAAVRSLMAYSEELSRRYGLTRQQQALLVALRGHPKYPAVTVGELAQRLQAQPHSTSRLIDRCVRQGLLDREQDQVDRRRWYIRLTPRGQQALDQVLLASRQELQQHARALFRESFRELITAPTDDRSSRAREVGM